MHCGVLRLTKIAETSTVTSPQKPRHNSKITKSTRKRRLPLCETLEVCRNFVRLNALHVFTQTWEPSFVAWMTLLTTTQIAPNGPFTDDMLAAAVRALDRVISGKDEPFLPPRFGYLQLFHFLELMRSRVKCDKKCGFIIAENHRTDAALAYERYRNAQDIPTTTSHLRRLRLIGSRWKDGVRSSPFLLIAFSKTAESFA